MGIGNENTRIVTQSTTAKFLQDGSNRGCYLKEMCQCLVLQTWPSWYAVASRFPDLPYSVQTVHSVQHVSPYKTFISCILRIVRAFCLFEVVRTARGIVCVH